MCSYVEVAICQSAGQGDLVVPQTRTAGFGARSFSVADPLAWNRTVCRRKADTTDTQTVLLWPAEN